MNAYLPGRVAERFKNSRIVVFSTGNVYPFADIGSAGSAEDSPAGPVGVYANSCLGRENVFRYFSKKNRTPVLLFRLNYAIDMRYGVLLEIAHTVYEGRPVDVSMGYFNAVWQGYANEVAIRSLFLTKTPPEILNVTGPEKVSVRETALKFAKLFGKAVEITGIEEGTALLSDSSKCMDLFGEPSVKIDDMIQMVAEWVSKSKPTIDKPTHFQERKGEF
jgi:nucleoside-diphosphate-sugar epimerase